MSELPQKVPPSVIQGAISAVGGLVVGGNAQAPAVGVQIAAATISAPSAAPTLAQATTGGSIAAGTYQVEVTYVVESHDYGTIESSASASASVTTTGSTSTITVTAPSANTNANYWNVYVTQAGGSTYTLQNALPLPLGPLGVASFTLTAPPTSTGAQPPSAPAWSGTIAFYASIDGVNVFPFSMTQLGGTAVTNTTASGIFTAPFGGLVFLIVVATAWTSGTAIVSINTPNAV